MAKKPKDQKKNSADTKLPEPKKDRLTPDALEPLAHPHDPPGQQNVNQKLNQILAELEDMQIQMGDMQNELAYIHAKVDEIDAEVGDVAPAVDVAFGQPEPKH